MIVGATEHTCGSMDYIHAENVSQGPIPDKDLLMGQANRGPTTRSDDNTRIVDIRRPRRGTKRAGLAQRSKKFD